jgi:hypothetical protein
LIDDHTITSVAGLNNNLQKVRLHKGRRKFKINSKDSDIEINKYNKFSSSINNNIMQNKRNSGPNQSNIFKKNFIEISIL